MIKHLKALTYICTGALCCTIVVMLGLAINGYILILIVDMLITLALFAMLVVLGHERKIQKIMGGRNHYRTTECNRWDRWC